MANANPSKMHGDDSHDGIPTKEVAKKAQEPLRIIDVSGKAVKVMAEYEVPSGIDGQQKTLRRDYA